MEITLRHLVLDDYIRALEGLCMRKQTVYAREAG